MIKLKLTKEKLSLVIGVLTKVIDTLDNTIMNMKPTIEFCRVKSDLCELKEISRKMRSKLVIMEDKPNKHPITYSVTEIQAFIIMYYRNICRYDPYSESIMNDISETIFKKLLVN